MSEEETTCNDLSFDTLGIPENILRGIYAYGFEKPSRIQDLAIPKIISGKDIIGQSQSGTGKTGAFSIGTLCQIDETKNSTQALIISPTHELAHQSFNVIKELSSYTKITSCKVIGGTNIHASREELNKNPHIIVGTPGRILDMITRKYLFTSDIKVVILDEADEILSYGFKDTIHNIVKMISKECQICIFSATMTDDILELTDQFMNQPEKLLIQNSQLTLEGIKQYYINVKVNDWKFDVITDIYDSINIGQCIIYINSKNKLLDVYNGLKQQQFPVAYINGDRTSEERKRIMEEFRAGSIRILLSTDLLSRGIDIQQLSLVINYDLPKEKETYIHRIGRSGRYGRKGVAINFITDYDIDYINIIKQHYNTDIEEMPSDISKILNT